MTVVLSLVLVFSIIGSATPSGGEELSLFLDARLPRRLSSPVLRSSSGTKDRPEAKIDVALLDEAEERPDELIPVIVILDPQPQWAIARSIKQEYFEKLAALYERHVKPVYSLAEEVKRILSDMRHELYEAGLQAVRPLQRQVEDDIARLGGRVKGFLVFVNAIIADLSYDAMLELAKSPLVAEIIRDAKLHASLNVSVPTIKAPTWWNQGYTGSPFRVAILDTGVDKQHPALQGRVVAERSFVPNEGPDDYNGHGTHVAGIVGSQDGTYKGVAPGAYLVNAKCLDSSGEGQESWVAQAAEWAVTQADADVLNLSAGRSGNDNGESDMSKFVDALTSYYDVIWVNAAGNSGPSSSTISIPADAYNCIAVGAMNDRNTVGRSDDTLWYYSSRGPTNDGRVKPDVVAPGVNIISCNNDWESGPDFVSYSGTSMAAPHIAGSVALLWAYSSNWHPVVVKALILNSADDLGSQGPDNRYGLGYVNLENAWNWRSYVAVNVVSEGEGKNYYVSLNAGESFKVTLVWERNVEYYNSWQSYDVYPINNLDLYVYDLDGTLIQSSTRSKDNFEQVSFTAPETGYYRIYVYGTDVDNVSQERFALAANRQLSTSIPDDDEEPPEWSNPQDDGDVYDYDQTDYMLQIDWTDESGIAHVWFRYKFGQNGTWSDWHEGTHVSGPTYRYDIPRSIWTQHVGKTLYWQSKAEDADNDYPGDSLTATSDVFTGGLLIDDDAEGPQASNPWDSGDIPDNSTESYVLQIDWTDPNDVVQVWFRYKFGENGTWSDWQEGEWIGGSTYRYEIDRSVWCEHIGEIIYWQSKAMDGDNDREGDGATSTTDVIVGGVIIDDDVDPPDWASPSASGDMYDNSTDDYVLQISWSDESGIAGVWFRYKFGENGTWSDWQEGAQVGDGVFQLAIPHDIWIQHVGETLYWQSKAMDGDDEGPNDGAIATSDVFTGGLLIDDDAEGPSFEGLGFSYISSSNSYRLLVNVSDSSGISHVVFFYRFGEDGEWASCNATGSAGPSWWLDLAEEIWGQHLGEPLFWYAIAYDADDDRPGDSACSTGPQQVAYYLDVETEPAGLPLPDDCGEGWYANASLAHASCYPIINESMGTRYVFSCWAGDANGTSSTSAPILMDGCKTAVARYIVQHRLGVVASGLPEGLEFRFSYGLSTGELKTGVATAGALWLSEWFDNGSLIYFEIVDKILMGQGQDVRYVFVAWNASSPLLLYDFLIIEASFKTQCLISLVFTTEDGSTAISPSEAWIYGSWPNGTLLRLRSPWEPLWLDLVEWTVMRVIWGNTNVISLFEQSYTPSPGGTWVVRCRVYVVSLVFVDADGEPFSPPPELVKLSAPNGTIVVISGGAEALMQNGTFSVLSVIWEGTEVGVETSFDPSRGRPVLPCRVYSVSLCFMDADGNPISPPSSYRLVFPNGTELLMTKVGFRCQIGEIRLVSAIWQSSEVGPLIPAIRMVNASGTYWFRIEVFNPVFKLVGSDGLGRSSLVLKLPNGTVRTFGTDENAELRIRVQKGVVEVLKVIRQDGYVAFVFERIVVASSSGITISLQGIPFEHPLVAAINEPLVSSPIIGPYLLAFDRLVMGYGGPVLIALLVAFCALAIKILVGRMKKK